MKRCEWVWNFSSVSTMCGHHCSRLNLNHDWPKSKTGLITYGIKLNTINTLGHNWDFQKNLRQTWCQPIQRYHWRLALSMRREVKNRILNIFFFTYFHYTSNIHQHTSMRTLEIEIELELPDLPSFCYHFYALKLRNQIFGWLLGYDKQLWTLCNHCVTTYHVIKGNL